MEVMTDKHFKKPFNYVCSKESNSNIFLESVSDLNFTNTGKVIEREYLWLTAPMGATPVN